MSAATWKPNEVEFFVARYLARRRKAEPRCYGLSSDALADYALGIGPRPSAWRDFPLDVSDLAACELTYEMAPERLKVIMQPVLVEYRRYVADHVKRWEESIQRLRVQRMNAPPVSNWERSQHEGMVVPCPYCGAPVGEWCHVVGKPDRYASWAHNSRLNAVRRRRSMAARP